MRSPSCSLSDRTSCGVLGREQAKGPAEWPYYYLYAILDAVTNQARVARPPDASTRDLPGVRFQPAKGGESSTGADGGCPSRRSLGANRGRPIERDANFCFAPANAISCTRSGDVGAAHQRRSRTAASSWRTRLSGRPSGATTLLASPASPGIPRRYDEAIALGEMV